MNCKECGSPCAEDPAGAYWCQNPACSLVQFDEELLARNRREKIELIPSRQS